MVERPAVWGKTLGFGERHRHLGKGIGVWGKALGFGLTFFQAVDGVRSQPTTALRGPASLSEVEEEKANQQQ